MQTARTTFVARRAFFSFLGPVFRIYDPAGALLYCIKQKAFRLKEELVIFGDEARTQAKLRINARSILDVRATYDVTDAATGENVGSAKREGLRSLLRDEWTIFAADGAEIAKIREDSLVAALMRRLLFGALFPQTFVVTGADGTAHGTIKQRFNPFQLAYDVDFTGLDPRLGVAATVLLLAIEGRQG